MKGGEESPKEDILFVVRGSLRASDRGELLRTLSNFGLEGVFLPLEAAAVQNNPESHGVIMPLVRITHRDQFIIREHFQEYRRTYNLSKMAMSNAFNWCIDTREDQTQVEINWDDEQRRWILLGEPESHPLLLVKSRGELGLPLSRSPGSSIQSQAFANYGIQTGSFIDLGLELAQKIKRSAAEEFIVSMSSQLVSQLTPEIH